MAVSARKRLNNDKYNAKCTQINLKPLTPEANAIKAAAKASGQSIQGYILQAVRERMAKEGQPLTLDDLPGADSAHTARRRADDHGPPAPAPVGTGRGVSILYGSESPKIF